MVEQWAAEIAPHIVSYVRAALSVPAPEEPSEEQYKALAGIAIMARDVGDHSLPWQRVQRQWREFFAPTVPAAVPAPEVSPDDYAGALREIAILEQNVRDARRQIADLQRSHEITDRENDALRAARWWVCPECGYHASISRKRGWRPRCRARHNGVRCTRTANSTGYCSSHARLFKPQPSIRGEA